MNDYDKVALVDKEQLQKLLSNQRSKYNFDKYICFKLVHSDGGPINSKKRFFDAAQYSLPIAHKVTQNWDALSDVLWQGFDNLSIEHVDIIWDTRDLIESNSRSVLIYGAGFLLDTLNGLKENYGARRNISFRVILYAQDKSVLKNWKDPF
ncbi:MAG: hypothetical protein AAF902_18340 [Chloroflexota bacterium]